MPLIIIEGGSVGEEQKTTNGLLPIGSEILLPRSQEVTGFEDQDTLSCPPSPNRVRQGHSQDMPAEGSIFDVSPYEPGFNMRPAGGGVQKPEIKQPPPSNYVSFNDPFFGAPIGFAQCHNTPGRIPQRQCQYITYRRTVTLVLTSRRRRQCSLREFHRTVFHGRLLKISYPFQNQTVLAYQPHSVLNASDFVESETSNAFDLRSPEDLFTDASDDLL